MSRHLSRSEMSALVELSESVPTLARLSDLLGVAPATIDRIVAGSNVHASTLARVRERLAGVRALRAHVRAVIEWRPHAETSRVPWYCEACRKGIRAGSPCFAHEFGKRVCMGCAGVLRARGVL